MAKGYFVVRGFVRKLGRGEHPGQGLPWPERPVDPGFGIEEGELPEVEPPDFEEGTPEHPMVPADPTTPPGTVWPPLPDFGQLPSPAPKKAWGVVYLTVPGYKTFKRFVCVDLTVKPAPTR